MLKNEVWSPYLSQITYYPDFLKASATGIFYSITTCNVCSLSLSCAKDITITQYFSI